VKWTIAITLYPKINTQTFSQLNSSFLSFFVAWKKNLSRFQVKQSFLPSRIILNLNQHLNLFSAKFVVFELFRCNKNLVGF